MFLLVSVVHSSTNTAGFIWWDVAAPFDNRTFFRHSTSHKSLLVLGTEDALLPGVFLFGTARPVTMVLHRVGPVSLYWPLECSHNT